MSVQYLWSNTDDQLPTSGAAAPPDVGGGYVPEHALVAPNRRVLWLDEQHEMPLLEVVDDGGWTAYFTGSGDPIVRADPNAWANDEWPTPPAVTPQEDWDVVGILGLPLPVPPPSRFPSYLYDPAEREAAITAVFPSDDSILPVLCVLTPPLQSRDPWLYEQNDWWGGGQSTAGQALWFTGSMPIP